MAFTIKDPETERLARRLADITGETVTEAVQIAIRDRLEREQRLRGRASVEHLLRIARRYAARPVVDARPADEILGYDRDGLPR